MAPEREVILNSLSLEPPIMPFRYNARYIFLTYPQCTLTTGEVFLLLSDINEIEAYTIAQENHAEGGTHIHAVLKFKRKFSTRSERYWDLEAFHPNIVVPRNIDAARTYVKKDGVFMEDGWTEAKLSYGELLNQSTTSEEFLSGVRRCYARDYVLQYEKVVICAEAHFKKKEQLYQPAFEEFLLPDTLTDWVTGNLVSTFRPIRPPLDFHRFAIILGYLADPAFFYTS